MLRRLHLVMAALAMLIAPVAMQSGMAMAAMPMDRAGMVSSQCVDEGSGRDSGGEDKSGVMTQCCVAMCSAVEPLGGAEIGQPVYPAPLLFGLRPTVSRAFLVKLPTPPPRLA